MASLSRPSVSASRHAQPPPDYVSPPRAGAAPPGSVAGACRGPLHQDLVDAAAVHVHDLESHVRPTRTCRPCSGRGRGVPSRSRRACDTRPPPRAAARRARGASSTSSIDAEPSTSHEPSARDTNALAASLASAGRSPTSASSMSVTVTSPSTAPNSSMTSAMCLCELRTFRAAAPPASSRARTARPG